MPKVVLPAQRVAETWGESVRRRRTSLRLSQTALGKMIDKDQSTVSRYERGEATWTPDVMLRFAVELGVAPGVLFAWPPMVEEMERVRLYGWTTNR